MACGWIVNRGLLMLMLLIMKTLMIMLLFMLMLDNNPIVGVAFTHFISVAVTASAAVAISFLSHHNR